MLVVEEDCTSLLHGMNGGGSVEEDGGVDETDMLDSDGVVVGAIVVVVVAVVFINVVLSIDDVGRVNGGVLVVAGGGNGTMVGAVMDIHGNDDDDVMTPLEGADGNVVGNT